jgi:MoxR-like ATPase
MSHEGHIPAPRGYQGVALSAAKTAKYAPLIFGYDRAKQRGFFQSGEGVVKDSLAPYIPDEEIKQAVRLLQVLRRPLLLRGEPGCGKTKLAQAVAYEWYGDDYRQHYFEWHIKSTSKAQEGLYSFDHISRLRYANLRRAADEAAAAEEEDLTRYRQFGPLGQAFAVSTAEKPAVILIDEIDKADIDFPNDLLLELDELRFTIKETGEVVRAAYPPVIFITSNQERDLPSAFLRRCLYHFIEFPGEEKLLQIVDAHFPGLLAQRGELARQALARFMTLREQIEQDPNVSKNVSTSELIDWFRAIDHYSRLADAAPSFDPEKAPPYHQVLLKSYNDLFREGLLEKS